MCTHNFSIFSNKFSIFSIYFNIKRRMTTSLSASTENLIFWCCLFIYSVNCRKSSGFWTSTLRVCQVKCLECRNAWVLECPSALRMPECPSAQFPWVPECPKCPSSVRVPQVPKCTSLEWPSTQAPFECPSAPSAQVLGVLTCPLSALCALSARIPFDCLNWSSARVPWGLERISASVSQSVTLPVSQLVYNADSVS